MYKRQLFFLAQLLQRRHQQSAWGSVLACLLFLLAAAGWLYTLCDSWSLWNAAQAAHLLTTGQLRTLQAAALTGAICALLPPLSQDVYKRQGQTNGGGCLAFAGRGGVDGSDENQLAIGTLDLFQNVVVHLSLVLAVLLQVLFVHTGGLGHFGDCLLYTSRCV